MAFTGVSRKIGGLILASGSLVSGHAAAQVMPDPLPVLPNDYPIERTGVAERWRPDYESQGLALGSLTVRPELGVGINHNSNVYGAKNGAIDDFYLAVNPQVVVGGDGGGQGTGNLQMRVDAALRRYADEKRANETAFGGDLTGTLPIGSGASVSGGASARRYYERQESGSFPSGSLAPIRYFDLASYIRMRTGGSRLRATMQLDVDHTQFSDAKLASGATLDQGYRDRTVLRGSGRLEASFTGATSGFVELRYSNIDYVRAFITPTEVNRDGKQAEVLAGGRIDSGKVRGYLAAGYTRRSFDSSQYKDFGGVAVNSEITYFASGLTTFTLTGYRNIYESGDPNISAQFTTGTGLRVDHELLRYVILSGRVGYDRSTYRGTSRKDEVASVRGSVRYLINRKMEVDAQAAYLKRTSSGTAFGADFNRFEFGVTLVGRI